MTLSWAGIALALLAPDLASATTAPPPELGAEAFVRWVYAQYSPGSNFDSQTAYSPSLRALFRVNARLNGPGEVGENNDSDEVCQCQEWDQMRLTALGVTPHGTKAEAIASFQDGPQHDTVTLELVQTPAGWRINDVLHPRPGASASLRARLLDETGRLRRAARLRP